MIEAGDTSCGRAPGDVVVGWVLRVQQLAADCADDAARIDLLAALESLKAAAAGCQAAVTVGFAATPTTSWHRSWGRWGTGGWPRTPPGSSPTWTPPPSPTEPAAPPGTAASPSGRRRTPWRI